MENNLMKTMEKQNEVIEEIMDLCAKELFNGQNIMNMRPEELRLVQLTLRLIKMTVETRVETAKVLENIQSNMELILSETTKES